LVQQGTQKEAFTKYMYFLKMSKVSFLENEFNTYNVAEVQLKRHQFYLIKITKKIRKIFDMGLQISLVLQQQSRFLVVLLGLHPSPLRPCQV